MEKELKAEDLFDKKIEIKNEQLVDPEYEVTVKLSSVGKLGLPAVLHVRDYSFDDTLIFAKANSENESAIVLELIKNIVYEDIDISKVTKQDVLEILMAVQGTFYSGVIDGKQYFIDETLTGEALTAKENISTATININDIKTLPLDKEVTVPINISNNKFAVLFDYPRLIHDVKAKEYIEEKFAARENELSTLIQKVRQGIASDAETAQVKQFNFDKNTEYMRVLTALQILSFNGKEVNSIEDKLELMHKLPVSVFTLLTKIFSLRFNFGVQDEVTFIDNETEKPITRRFDFRYIDFIPALEQGNESGFNVSFG